MVLWSSTWIAITTATPRPTPSTVRPVRSRLDAQLFQTTKDVSRMQVVSLQGVARIHLAVIQEQHPLPRRRIARVVGDQEHCGAVFFGQVLEQDHDFFPSLGRQV